MSTGDCPSFNFEEEYAPFLEAQQIKSATHVPAEGGGDTILITFTTLEDSKIECLWGTQCGLVVQKVEPAQPNVTTTQFDSLEGLFTEYSPMYRDKFHNDLSSKLFALIG